MIFEASADGRRLRVEVRRRDERYEVDLGDERRLVLDVHEAGRREFLSLIVDGRSYDVGVERLADGYRVAFADDIIDVRLEDAARAGSAAARPTAEGPARVSAPMPGKLVSVLVGVGDEVDEGQGLVVMEAMKMENELRAPRAGRVVEVAVAAGQAVETGALLVALE